MWCRRAAPQAWTLDPFAATLARRRALRPGRRRHEGRDRRLRRGGARFLAARGSAFDGSISLLITGDEEGAAINGTKKVLDWLQARGETLDACVVGEPTSADALGDMIKIGRRGSLTGRLTVHGVQGHTAYPHLADNAAHRLVAMLHALTARPLDDGTEHFQPSTLQVTDDRHRQPGHQRHSRRGARHLQHPLQRPLVRRAR